MENKYLIINLHSFVDVITNSSTELFVGNTSKSIDFIREILGDYINIYNKYDNCDSLDSIINITSIDESNCDFWVGDIFNWTIPYWIEMVGEVPRERSYEKYDDFLDAFDKYLEINKESFKKQLMGSIVIEGKNDNSIPYELFELIKSLFEKNVCSVHKG